MKNKTCGECKHYIAEMYHCQKNDVMAEDFNTCEDFEPKVITNGDRIRQMSNEELVAFFITRDASYCVPDARPGDCEASKDCKDHWLRWLNAPAKEGEDE